ncbi:restriction endonuclease subunit S, partial [Ralstonia solanacearum]|uniref:restriction endonuclease subunit S n=1 Tax=Ralstonia solanacearum TaxID=305 RepID=UPI001E3E17FA
PILDRLPYFRDGDVALAKITPCFENGKGAVMHGLRGGIGFGTTELIIARPRASEVTGPLLNWIFRSPIFRKQGEASMYGAGGQKRVPDDFVRNFVWAFPPLAEQIGVAAFLDRETAKIDALIAEQEKLVTLLAEKRQATISHVFTRGLRPNPSMKSSGVAWLGEVPAHWNVRKIGRDVDVLPGFAFPSSRFSLDDSNIKLLRGLNVGVGALRWEEVVYWDPITADGLESFELCSGDIVLGMDRPWIAGGLRVARVSEVDTPCLLVQRVAALRIHGELHPDYLLLALQTGYFYDHCFPEMTGVSVPHISPEQIRSFTVPVPPIDEQLEIAAFVSGEGAKLEALSIQAQRSIELLKERRCALITAAVTGQIDVRGVATQSPAQAEPVAA